MDSKACDENQLDGNEALLRIERALDQIVRLVRVMVALPIAFALGAFYFYLTIGCPSSVDAALERIAFIFS